MKNEREFFEKEFTSSSLFVLDFGCSDRAFRKNGDGTYYYTSVRGSWEMWQASQQAKIDKLQCRIDEVLKVCDNLRTDLIREHHAEYDKGWKDCATSIYHKLKGNGNEN